MRPGSSLRGEVLAGQELLGVDLIKAVGKRVKAEMQKEASNKTPARKQQCQPSKISRPTLDEQGTSW